MSVIYINSYQFAAPAGATDPYFSNVSLLLHGDGTNGSTTIVDSSSNNFTITPVGNAQISTTQSKFGGASMYFDGSGDYLEFFGESLTGDFTIECWLYSTSTSDRIVASSDINSNLQLFRLNRLNSGAITCYLDNVFISGGTVISTNTWHHAALTRQGSTVRLFVDGTFLASISTSNTIVPNKIGRYFFNGSSSPQFISDFSGYLVDLRITKGVARYTTNFTPPAAPFPDA